MADTSSFAQLQDFFKRTKETSVSKEKPSDLTPDVVSSLLGDILAAPQRLKLKVVGDLSSDETLGQCGQTESLPVEDQDSLPGKLEVGEIEGEAESKEVQPSPEDVGYVDVRGEDLPEGVEGVFEEIDWKEKRRRLKELERADAKALERHHTMERNMFIDQEAEHSDDDDDIDDQERKTRISKMDAEFIDTRRAHVSLGAALAVHQLVNKRQEEDAAAQRKQEIDRLQRELALREQQADAAAALHNAVADMEREARRELGQVHQTLQHFLQDEIEIAKIESQKMAETSRIARGSVSQLHAENRAKALGSAVKELESQSQSLSQSVISSFGNSVLRSRRGEARKVVGASLSSRDADSRSSSQDRSRARTAAQLLSSDRSLFRRSASSLNASGSLAESSLSYTHLAASPKAKPTSPQRKPSAGFAQLMAQYGEPVQKKARVS